MLEPGTPQFEAYYHDHPEHLAPDNVFRANPGLLRHGATFFDPFLGASPQRKLFSHPLTHRSGGWTCLPRSRSKGLQKS